KPIRLITIRDLEGGGLTAGYKGPNLVNGLESLGMECHDHPPMIPNSRPPSSSSVLGNARLAQAHVSLDNATSGQNIRSAFIILRFCRLRFAMTTFAEHKSLDFVQMDQDV